MEHLNIIIVRMPKYSAILAQEENTEADEQDNSCCNNARDIHVMQT